MHKIIKINFFFIQKKKDDSDRKREGGKQSNPQLLSKQNIFI